MLKLLRTYILLLLQFFVLMVGVTWLIPSDAIRDNVHESAKMLDEEGPFPSWFNFPLFKFDNFTDAVMLNTMIAADSNHPVDAAMLNAFYHEDSEENIAKEVLILTERKQDVLPCTHYATYWHGYQVTLRPLLYIMPLKGIRILNCILTGFLALLTIFLLWREQGGTAAGLFAISLCAVNIFMVPLSCQFATCFIISMIGMIAVMYNKRLTATASNITCTFFTLGAVCAFFDFLTTPLLTYCLPLTAWLLCKDREGEKGLWKHVFQSGAAWAAGYALLWCSKWFVAYLITGENVPAEALDSILVRTGIENSGTDLSLGHIAEMLYSAFDKRGIAWALYALIAAAAGTLIFYFTKYSEGAKRYSWLLLIAAAAPVWFIAVRNHSFIHLWFTWRVWMSTLWAIMLFLYYVPKKTRR